MPEPLCSKDFLTLHGAFFSMLQLPTNHLVQCGDKTWSRMESRSEKSWILDPGIEPAEKFPASGPRIQCVRTKGLVYLYSVPPSSQMLQCYSLNVLLPPTILCEGSVTYVHGDGLLPTDRREAMT